MRGRAGRAAAVAALAVAGAACADAGTATPRCEPGERLGIVAQSVPGAAYLPCVAELPPGWSVDAFEVDDDGTHVTLVSDRADDPVDVALTPGCDVRGATPVTPRDEGVRTYLQLSSVSERYAGRLVDVFADGCVSYTFDFARGPHIALLDELQRAVQLYPRRQLRQELADDLGVTLDP